MCYRILTKWLIADLPDSKFSVGFFLLRCRKLPHLMLLDTQRYMGQSVPGHLERFLGSVPCFSGLNLIFFGLVDFLLVSPNKKWISWDHLPRAISFCGSFQLLSIQRGVLSSADIPEKTVLSSLPLETHCSQALGKRPGYPLEGLVRCSKIDSSLEKH